MAKLADIALNDSTPTSRNFEVVRQVGAESSLRNDNSNIAVSERDLVQLTFRPEKNSVPVKASAKIICPPTAAEKAADETVDDVTLFIHVVRKENASPERVANVMAYGKDLLANAIFVDMVVNAAQPY